MSSRDGFGLHIDFAHRVIARSVRVAPSGLDNLQVEFAVPGEIGRGEVELTQLGEGVSYGSWTCDDAQEETSMDTELPPNYLAFPFHLLPEPVEVGIQGIAQPIVLPRTESYILGPSVVGTQTIRPGVPVRQICLYVNAQTINSCFADRQEALPTALKRAFTHAESEPTFLRGRATTAMGLALRQMLTCNLHGGVARLYLRPR